MQATHPSTEVLDSAGIGMASGTEVDAWRVEPREWDSRTFGFAIGRLVRRPEAEPDPLCLVWEGALVAARLDGMRLVYGEAAPHIAPDPALLTGFGGALVAEAVLYAGDVAHLARGGKSANGLVTRNEPCIEELAPNVSCEGDLHRLSLAAGAHSRFSVDPRFPRDGFETLYRTWIERSVRHEIADKVFVWRNELGIGGLVTAEIRSGTGRIGLLAVDASLRGRGVGGGLVRAAARWMAEEGATRCEVATQRGNTLACEFYERVGFGMASMRATYHFWLEPS